MLHDMNRLHADFFLHDFIFILFYCRTGHFALAAQNMQIGHWENSRIELLIYESSR